MTLHDSPRPRGGSRFYKAHGLGNDYLVFEEGEGWTLTPEAVARVCDRFHGPGSDGIVLLGSDVSQDVFRLRMFNPDGSEFERSGNGLRVLASYLARKGRVERAPFAVEVGGDRVSMTVHDVRGGVHDVSVDMGRAEVGARAVALLPSFLDADGQMAGPDGGRLTVTPVSVGNPHLVAWMSDATEADLHAVGPFLSQHPGLANGANVQLASMVGPATCRALIWERGVGRTSASGTSSCAVAVAAVSRGLTPPGTITVEMEGGRLQVEVSPELDVRLRGPVEEVFEGSLTEAFIGTLDQSGA